MRLFYLYFAVASIFLLSVTGYSQNIGIGVPNPLQKLHVGGSVRIDGLAIAGTGVITTNANGDLLRTNFSGNANDVLRGNGTFGAAPASLPSGALVVSPAPNDQNLLMNGFSFYGEMSSTATAYYSKPGGLSLQFTQAPIYETGDPLKTQALSPRGGHSAVWTGTEMIAWGGYSINTDGEYEIYNDGSKYNPQTDNWTMISIANAPQKSTNHSAVWTGTEMIVWGGIDSLYAEFLGNGSRFLHNSGKRYNPATNVWANMASAGAPTARYNSHAVWTGSYMVVWGGTAADGVTALSDGARYNPATDSWLPIATLNAPIANAFDTRLFWTGTYVVVFGNNDTVARYNPSANTWLISAKYPAPLLRRSTLVWTGSEIWAYEAANKRIHKYNPSTNIWTNITIGGSIFPDASFNIGAAVWSDTEMVLLINNKDASGAITGNSCYNYNPGSNTFHSNIGTIRYSMRVEANMTFIKAGSIILKWGGHFANFDPDVLTLIFNRQGTRIYLTSGINITPVYLRSTAGKLYLYRKN